jgi:hypothetical protein
MKKTWRYRCYTWCRGFVFCSILGVLCEFLEFLDMSFNLRLDNGRP